VAELMQQRHQRGAAGLPVTPASPAHRAAPA
jgi:hypothetical protein